MTKRMTAPGDRLGRYAIEERLGVGGTGEVYRAHDTVLDRWVALKLLARHDVARLLREARAAAALDHPNVVAVFDVGEVDGAPFIAMELVRGRPLRELIGQPDIAIDRRLRWMLDIAHALVAAHGRGLIHRDIKPSNVIVRDDGVAKVLDFGIARRDASLPPSEAGAADIPTITEDGTFVGTPGYASPEQVRGERGDARSDQFSWGVVAYEVLTGRFPWGSAVSHAERALAVMTEDVAGFRERVRGLPARVEGVVLRALARDPAARFPSMKDLASELEPWVTGTSISATQVPVGQEPRPRRGAIVGVAAGVAAGVLGLVAASSMAAKQRTTPAAAPSAVATSASSTDRVEPPEALAAYRAAIQAVHDGVAGQDLSDMQRAVDLDPRFAAAQLRLAIWTFTKSETTAREHFYRAIELRDGLTPRDQALLDAFEPYVQRQPSDVAETDRRLAAASQRYPEDAEIGLAYARIHWTLTGNNDFGEFRRVLALDPRNGAVYQELAEQMLYAGGTESALATIDRCLKEVPTATLCLAFQAIVDQETGDCAKMESDARQLMAVDPSTPGAYHTLAEALVGQGRDADAVREALGQAWAHMEGRSWEGSVAADRFSIAVLEGDFASAEKSALDIRLAVASSRSVGDHAEAEVRLMLLAEETGRMDDAGRIAADFVSREDGWMLDPRREDFAIARDPTPRMLEIMRRAGRLDRAQFVERRDGWAHRWRDMVLAPFLPYVWLHGYAEPAETPQDAADALAALGDYGAIPRFYPRTFAVGDVARVYELAGRQDDALAQARQAAASCAALDFPIEHTRAQLLLAQILEREGDVAGACARYDAVLARWDRAPSSITASAARARAKALGCAAGQPSGER